MWMPGDRIDAGADGNDAGVDGGGDAGLSGDAGTKSDGGSETQGTPTLVTASLVTHGTVSLAWQNPASTCATVEVNRNKNAGAYAVAQTLSGSSTSVQDMPGHTSGTYCYTITCKLNGLASAPSNEKCVTQ